MFTGIIETLGTVEQLERSAHGGRLTVAVPGIELAVAGSIAVNGCCLTIVEAGADHFSADLSAETLQRTAFGEMKPRTVVNVERPLTAGKEFGGHFVQGHVDGIGRVARLAPERPAPGAGTEERSWLLAVRVPDELGKYVAMKGSIAIDGISLTVASFENHIAEFAVIPFTYSHTNVCGLTVGDAVNLECDVLAKYVERLLEDRTSRQSRSRLTVSELIDQGF
jgi:riboflavin synthase